MVWYVTDCGRQCWYPFMYCRCVWYTCCDSNLQFLDLFFGHVIRFQSFVYLCGVYVWIKSQILYHTVVWFIVYMICSMNPMLLVTELVNFSKRECLIVIIEVIEILGQCLLKLIVQ